jgi:regulator of sigma E protease
MPAVLLGAAIAGVKVLLIGGVVLTVLILVHEIGHFVAAKLCRIRVLAFSMGFGKHLFVKTIGETEFRICAIPVGGYVHMAGEHPDDDKSKDPHEMQNRPIWQRAIVAIAGPAANVVFSLLLLWVYFMAGSPESSIVETSRVGWVEDSSVAQVAGFQVGDSILSINGQSVSSWKPLDAEFSRRRSPYTFEVRRDTARLVFTIDIPLARTADDIVNLSGGLHPARPARVGLPLHGSPAALAGFKAGDSIASVNGAPVHAWDEMSALVMRHDSASGPMAFVVVRGGVSRQISVAPRYDATARRYMIGISPYEYERIVRHPPVQAAVMAFNKSGEFSLAIVDVVRGLLTRRASPKELAGPLGIVQISGFVALQGGLGMIINLIALLGINLAVINLVPLVITDGGMLLFLLLEAIRGKPLPLKAQDMMARIAIAFFIALFLFVTFNDIARLPMFFRMLLGGR